MIYKLLAISLLSSCAIKTISNNQAYEEILTYKDISQKTQLDNIVAEKHVVSDSKFLKPIYNKHVAKWVEYFSAKDKARFERFLANGDKYKDLIQSIFREHSLPEDLFYVGLIESGYYLKSKSRASAVGPWQFIKATGKRYHLAINNTVDERSHIVKSTKAAALYFQDLYNIFGSWELALAAYNAGEYGVIRRIRSANTRDFHELAKMKKLPKETRQYVPKVLAAMEVAKNRSKYRLRSKKVLALDKGRLEKITLHKSYRVHDLAKKSNMTTQAFLKLNSDLKSYRTPYYPKSGFTIYTPTKMSVRGLASVKVKKPQRSRSQTYKVRSGDNLIKIAKKFGVKTHQIKSRNKLKSSKIYIGQRLKIPASNGKIHTVRKGDYLLKIAKNYGKSLQQLRSLNGKKLNRIYPGQKILISLN